ncbi:hypothetical protein [Methanosarcina sp.]|uniref:hypothetical protein n=1 Tax=Methanosarcina sp. TaxID=2213 RepID=UPI002AB85E63|nr:hypothetical protein [Methanosarcina sp.]MDY9924896.1 hypothetical protein [Methanosarcina sp.]
MENINNQRLFLNGSLDVYCDDKRDKANKEISRLTSDSIKGIDEHEMADKLYCDYKVEAPIITLESSNCHHEKHSDNIVVYHIPFTGNGELFSLKPLKWTTAEPYGNVMSNEIIIEYPLRDDAECINKEFENNYKSIIKWLGFISTDCTKFNPSLKEDIEVYVRAKYKKLNGNDENFRNL